jgi:hypothetical protein
MVVVCEREKMIEPSKGSLRYVKILEESRVSGL